MKKEMKKTVAKGVKKVLNSALKLEANSASCVFLFEPKSPNGLKNFKKK